MIELKKVDYLKSNNTIYPEKMNINSLSEINWIISKFGIRAGTTTILNAYSNVGKSFLGMHIAACVANDGLNLFPNVEIEKHGKVVHFDWEMGYDDVNLYYQRLLHGLNLDKNCFDNIKWCFPNYTLEDSDSEILITHECKNQLLAIIDCLGPAIPNIDINSEMTRKYIDLLNRIARNTGCAIIVLHHEAKSAGSGIRSVKGNGSIIAAAGGSIQLQKTDEKTNKIHLTLGKVRMTDHFEMDYEIVDCGLV